MSVNIFSKIAKPFGIYLGNFRFPKNLSGLDEYIEIISIDAIIKQPCRRGIAVLTAMRGCPVANHGFRDTGAYVALDVEGGRKRS